MNRRLALMAGSAVAAGAAGAGVALWKSHSGGDGAAAALWPMRFDTPTGGSLTLASLRGRPLLLNFWATWCPPCISELPLLDRFFREQQAGGWQVVGLAVDNLAPVRGFLDKRPVGFPIGLAGLEGVALSRQLGNAGGALPFSVVFDRDANIVQRKLGVIAESDLQHWVAAVAT